MKFLTLIEVILLTILSLIFDVKGSNTVSQEALKKPKGEYKMLFVYYNPSNKDPSHPMNKFDYKNIVLNNDQVVFFISNNPSLSSPDTDYQTINYLYTMKYINIDLPCLGQAYVCTHAQFMKEYKSRYLEIITVIPKDIQERMGDAGKASKNCLTITRGTFLNVDQLVWICHEDLMILYEFQDKLSNIIASMIMKPYTGVIEYIKDKNKVLAGQITLTKDLIRFSTPNGKQENIVLEFNFNTIKGYAIPLYKREKLRWEGEEAAKPLEEKCFKIEHIVESETVAQYFCSYYSSNDVKRKYPLINVQSRLAVELWVGKINLKILEVNLKTSQDILIKGTLKNTIDDKVLMSIKIKIRIDYLLKRHFEIEKVKMGLQTKDDLNKKLPGIRDSIVDKICVANELCKNAIKFSIEKGFLPLHAAKSKVSMSLINPYFSSAPNISLKVSNPNDKSVGKELVAKAVELLGGKANFFAESLTNIGSIEVPSKEMIVKATNLFAQLRSKAEVKNMESLVSLCQSEKKHNSSNLKRKIALMHYVGINDPFFEYLGFIRDTQLK